jgi:hypothetical protein
MWEIYNLKAYKAYLCSVMNLLPSLNYRVPLWTRKIGLEKHDNIN